MRSLDDAAQVAAARVYVAPVRLAPRWRIVAFAIGVARLVPCLALAPDLSWVHCLLSARENDFDLARHVVEADASAAGAADLRHVQRVVVPIPARRVGEEERLSAVPRPLHVVRHLRQHVDTALARVDVAPLLSAPSVALARVLALQARRRMRAVVPGLAPRAQVRGVRHVGRAL
eukprot:CAMPEP_0115568856 /NCGR_PEP_ID=MMETSP0271-20121206/104894_1 /TAXON_ID=71861 /ORGANISM="Scrippsiella trochoidea, Strain CCMP3099" /LENGTH=174 /DNA_ID=CAMNT_0003003365 /DNA_START=186 /DNA_END=708 /DNA_ORIENTATION=+